MDMLKYVSKINAQNSEIVAVFSSMYQLFPAEISVKSYDWVELDFWGS